MYEIEIDPPVGGPPTSAPPVWSSSDPAQIEALSDAELDALPFGVMCLDRQGMILRYNLAEARMARLDRANVLGKSFFGHVARCTARPEFQGRFEAFLRSEQGPPVERFTFLFDFKFGAQLVTIELVRSRKPDRAYILVNRAQILPARPDAEDPAVSLSQLEGAAPEGVLRDARDTRYVKLPAAALQSLLAAAARMGLDGPALLSGWGFEWGRTANFDLEAFAMEEHGQPLHALRVGEALELGCRAFREQGWGDLSIDLGPAPRTGAFMLRVERSALHEALRCAPALRHGFTEGYLRAIFSHLAGRRLVVRHIPEQELEDPLADGVFVALDGILAQGPAPAERVLDLLGQELPAS